MRKIAQFKFVRIILRCFFSIFYQKKYLVGKYFDQKSMGWIWAWRGLHGRIWGENHKVPWPVHPRTIVQGADNISFPQDSFHIFQVPGCYWQAFDAKISIGNNCHVAPNVGIVTTNCCSRSGSNEKLSRGALCNWWRPCKGDKTD